MTSRKWLLIASAAATLTGCAAPYYDDPYYTARDHGYDYPAPYYRPGYYGPPPNYAPGYYVAPPAVSFGFSYSDHGGHHH